MYKIYLFIYLFDLLLKCQKIFFLYSFSKASSSIKRMLPSSLEDKLFKEILFYEIELFSRYIIIKNVKDLNSLNNNNGNIL